MNVTTYHYDNPRTGWNPHEAILTPNNVAGPDFGVLFKYGSDVFDDGDAMNAQPLYLQGVVIDGVTLNVVFIAARSGRIYAFDADNFRVKTASQNSWLWQTYLVGDTGATESAAPDGALMATPVIDAVQSVMYVVGKFQDTITKKQYFRLHALDVTTGLDVPGLGPVQIDGKLVPTVSGSGDPQSLPGQVFFDPHQHFNRPALLLANNTVYVAFGSTGDFPPYHGWMLAFRTKDLELVGSFCTTPDSTKDDGSLEGINRIDVRTLGGGIWQAGFGPAADNDGFVYFMTGNGLNDVGSTNRNYADSLLQLNASAFLTGSFTPPDPLSLTDHDTDFGSTGPMVLPDGVGGGNFVVGCGKDANVYLLDRTQLATNLNQIGKYKSTIALDSNSKSTDDGGGPGVWGGPAYYGGPLGKLIYYCGDAGPLQAFAVDSGLLTPALTSSSVANQTPPTERFPGEGGIIPVVTSNGSTPGTGLVWGITRPGDPKKDPLLLRVLHLRAYDAADLTKGSLFDAVIGPWFPQYPKGTGAFLAPLVVNGKVYVATDRQLTVYTLISKVPDCTGLTLKAATKAIKAAGLKVGDVLDTTKDDPPPPGETWGGPHVVQGQSPSPGTTVVQGSSVDLELHALAKKKKGP